MLQICRMEAIHQRLMLVSEETKRLPPKRMQESWGDITLWSFDIVRKILL